MTAGRRTMNDSGRTAAMRRPVRGAVLLAGAVAAVTGLAWAEIAAAADIDGRRDPRSGTRIVAGPIVGGAAANNGYYAYGPYASPGAPLPWSRLYGPAVPVAPGCWMQRQRIWTEYGWRWRTAPICY